MSPDEWHAIAPYAWGMLASAGVLVSVAAGSARRWLEDARGESRRRHPSTYRDS